MKKKIVALSVIIAMLAIALIGGTMAYFTDTDDATNVFTMGNVQIVQTEYERVKDENGDFTNEVQLFTNNQKVYPAVYELPTGDPERMYDLSVNGYNIDLGVRTFPNYVDKMVTVKNTGNSDAYVRTIIAIPVSNDDESDNDISQSWLHVNQISSSDTTPANGWYYGTPENKAEYPDDYADHYIVKGVTINGRKYDLTVITNVNKLAPNAETSPNMVGFYLDNDLNWDDFGGYYMPGSDGDKIYIGNAFSADNVILVASQAVQAEGFADAWEAFAASFGEISDDNHPWKTE